MRGWTALKQGARHTESSQPEAKQPHCRVPCGSGRKFQHFKKSDVTTGDTKRGLSDPDTGDLDTGCTKLVFFVLCSEHGEATKDMESTSGTNCIMDGDQA